MNIGMPRIETGSVFVTPQTVVGLMPALVQMFQPWDNVARFDAGSSGLPGIEAKLRNAASPPSKGGLFALRPHLMTPLVQGEPDTIVSFGPPPSLYRGPLHTAADIEGILDMRSLPGSLVGHVILSRATDAEGEFSTQILPQDCAAIFSALAMAGAKVSHRVSRERMTASLSADFESGDVGYNFSTVTRLSREDNDSSSRLRIAPEDDFLRVTIRIYLKKIEDRNSPTGHDMLAQGIENLLTMLASEDPPLWVRIHTEVRDDQQFPKTARFQRPRNGDFTSPLRIFAGGAAYSNPIPDGLNFDSEGFYRG